MYTHTYTYTCVYTYILNFEEEDQTITLEGPGIDAIRAPRHLRRLPDESGDATRILRYPNSTILAAVSLLSMHVHMYMRISRYSIYTYIYIYVCVYMYVYRSL